MRQRLKVQRKLQSNDTGYRKIILDCLTQMQEIPSGIQSEEKADRAGLAGLLYC